MWHGYFLITVSNNITESERAKCLGVAWQSGLTPYTNKPHEKTQIIEKLDKTAYIIEASRESGEPDIEWIRQGVADNTDITKERADEIITSFTIFDSAEDCRNFLATNKADWWEDNG